MAAGNSGNGAGTPEDDDPFGYLYADGQTAGAQGQHQGGYGYPGPAAAPQPGRPRTSYNQVRAVGERQWGGQAPAQPQGAAPQAYGQPPAQPQYGQPHPQYAAPETYPGGGASTQPVPAQSGGRGGGPNTRGLLIGAIAVVLVVVAGITVAMLNKDSDGKNNDARSAPSAPAPTGVSEESPSTEPSPSDSAKPDLPKRDAATLELTPPATLGTDVPGAKGTEGAYVQFNGVGGAASWKFEVPEDGTYTMYLTYSVPGKDAKATLTVNGGQPREINMANFAKAPEGAWEKGWTNTYSYMQLDKGENTLKMSCEAGNSCEAYLDQVWLVYGEAGKKG
ncbi:carbohydrate-binding protein [Streptomyces sp. MUM 203J]|uniref:carbohydrate-binding protein n=1 Tax=Streptomyces sp. MUM 203J TaxID=2791990 RepID=UPI001F04CFFC|nr:carbohydrate-binding protein [Streptomyces sp. MUM 203J]MCH0538632.1 carbohydrate-binding protein [Streptomyces sp. MUM 203J]